MRSDQGLKVVQLIPVLAISLSGLLAHGSTCAAEVGNADATFCEAEYSVMMEDASRGEDPAGQLTRWESLGERCGADRQYNLRKGYLHLKAGDLAGAEKILNDVLRTAPEYRRYALYSLFEVAWLSGNTAEAKARAVGLAREFAGWGGGYAALGRIFLVQSQFQESIKFLEKSNLLFERDGSQSDAGNFQRLAIAYYNVGRYQDAVSAMQKALRLSPQGLGHGTSVCATAASLIKLGELPAARDLLAKHLELSPGSRSDDFCSRVIAYFGDI